MALQNKDTGEYLRVIGFQLDKINNHFMIEYQIFKNAEQRKRFRKLSKYETYKRGMFDGEIKSHFEIPMANITAKDAMFKACYENLKTDMFKNWIDV